MRLAGRLAAAVLSAVALAATGAAGDEKAVADAYWDVRYAAAGFEALPRPGGVAQIVRGRLPGGIAVEVHVVEDDAVRDGAAWIGFLRTKWADEGRAMTSVEGPDAAGVLLFSEAGPGGATRRHAYAVQPRGVHGFVAHAAGAPGDDAALRKAVAGLVVGARTGATLRAAQAARATGDPPTGAGIVLRAVSGYLAARPPQALVAAEGAHDLPAEPTADLDAEELWDACHSIGLALLTRRDTAPALAWLTRARALAPAVRRGGESAVATTVYNLACAHAVAGDADSAFRHLDELVASKTWPQFARWAQEDPDLERLRKDPRWSRLPAPQPK